MPLIFGHGSRHGVIKIYVFDYLKTGQRCLENTFKLKILNQLRNKYERVSLKDIEKMTEAGLDALDHHPTFDVLGSTVNFCACYMVGETIKLLTVLGKLNFYPKETVLDVFESKFGGP